MRRAFSTFVRLLILVALATASYKAVHWYEGAIASFHLSSAANRLSADLTYAQCQAQVSGTPVIVVFDTANDTYLCTSAKEFRRGWSAYRVSLAAEPYRCHLLSTSLGRSQIVTYGSRGTPDAGGEFVLCSGTCTCTVRLDGPSGRITVQ